MLRCRASVCAPLIAGALFFAGPADFVAAQPSPRLQPPEFVGGVDWLGVVTPLTLKQLRGKVVLVHFWTLCCINCMQTQPEIARLEKKYAKQLVVIGIHSPKYDHEKSSV